MNGRVEIEYLFSRSADDFYAVSASQLLFGFKYDQMRNDLEVLWDEMANGWYQDMRIMRDLDDINVWVYPGDAFIMIQKDAGDYPV
jgi:hypothetical protein